MQVVEVAIVTGSFTSSGVLLVGDYCRWDLSPLCKKGPDSTVDQKIVFPGYNKKKTLQLKSTSLSTAVETQTPITLNNSSVGFPKIFK